MKRSRAEAACGRLTIFDRYIRDQRQYDTAKHYIEMNPVAAGLCDAPGAWPFSSAGWK